MSMYSTEQTHVLKTTEEGDMITISLDTSHPIVKFQFNRAETITGEYVESRHGVVRIKNSSKQFVNIPHRVIGGIIPVDRNP